MRYDAEILNEFRQIIDALRQKKMTQQEALRRLREIGNEIELDQWQIIEDLRTRAPENQRELARELTDLLAAELRKRDSETERYSNTNSIHLNSRRGARRCSTISRAAAALSLTRMKP
jgi:hypothetical protein